MKKHFNIKCLYLVSLFLLQLGLVFSVVHAEDTELILHDDSTNEANLSQVMHSIIENNEKFILDIEAERENYKVSVRDEIVHLTKVYQDINNDYNMLYKVYVINKDQPTELSLTAEQISTFIFQISELYDPLDSKRVHIQKRIKQLDNILESLKAINNETARSMVQRTTRLRSAYVVFDKRLTRVITTTRSFLDTLTEMSKELEERMPRFWLRHYLTMDAEFLKHVDVWSQASFYKQVWELLI